MEENGNHSGNNEREAFAAMRGTRIAAQRKEGRTTDTGLSPEKRKDSNKDGLGDTKLESTKLIGPITPDDVNHAFNRVHPAPLSCDKSRYEQWNDAFGSQ